MNLSFRYAYHRGPAVAAILPTSPKAGEAKGGATCPERHIVNTIDLRGIVCRQSGQHGRSRILIRKPRHARQAPTPLGFHCRTEVGTLRGRNAPRIAAVPDFARTAVGAQSMRNLRLPRSEVRQDCHGSRALKDRRRSRGAPNCAAAAARDVVPPATSPPRKQARRFLVLVRESDRANLRAAPPPSRLREALSPSPGCC